MKIPHHNEGFVCAYCGEENPPAPQTCRNHCRKCLISQHVDRDLPGDRLAECGGKMIPKKIDQHSKKEWMIVHECEVCQKIQRNKIAADDNFEMVVKIAEEFAEKEVRKGNIK